MSGPSGWERGLSLRVGRQWELGCGVEVSAYPGGRRFYIHDTKVGILFDCGERDVPISASAASFFLKSPLSVLGAGGASRGALWAGRNRDRRGK